MIQRPSVSTSRGDVQSAARDPRRSVADCTPPGDRHLDRLPTDAASIAVWISDTLHDANR